MLPLLAVVAGCMLLVWGADRFVLGGAVTARNLGVAPLIIGLTIVGFGTSAPEVLVSAVAAWSGQRGLAVGNALGSNITNIGLVLGSAALAAPLKVHSGILRRELPILLLIMFLVLALILDGDLSRGDGMVLIGSLGALFYWLVNLGLRGRGDPILVEFSGEMPAAMSTARALMWLAAGLLVLLVSSRLLVWGAVQIALALGVSDLVIGLTVVAIGTSLPELAASVMSALRGQHDIAIGNVIGSNMFNLLGVLAMPGLIAPGPLDPEVTHRDYGVMLGLTLALVVMAYGFGGRPGRINRIEGAVLLAVFVGFLAWVYHAS